MKFLLVVFAIRYVFILLGRLTKDETAETVDDAKKFIHPSEYKTRW